MSLVETACCCFIVSEKNLCERGMEMHKILVTALILTITMIFGGTAFAEFPDKPVTVMVPYNPGGGSDSSARVMAKYMAKYLDNPVIVSNKPGGGGFSEPARILKTRTMHNGYMLMLLGGINVYPELYQQSYPYVYKDFRPIGNISLSIGCIAVAADSPYKTLKDFVDAAKASEKPIKYSRAAAGGTSHITPVLLSDTYGVPLEDIPYNGDSDSATALLRGEVEVCSANPAALIPHHQGGTVRILAVFAPTRMAALPDVPTFEEAGFSLPISALSPIGIFAPADIPEDAAVKLSNAMLEASKDPDFAVDMNRMSLFPYVVVGEDYDKQMEEFASIIGPIIKKVGLYK